MYNSKPWGMIHARKQLNETHTELESLRSTVLAYVDNALAELEKPRGRSGLNNSFKSEGPQWVRLTIRIIPDSESRLPNP